MKDHDNIPNKLKALRAKAGLSVREVARRMGVPDNTYANYEAPRYKKPYLPFEKAEKIAEAFVGTGVSRDEVMALAGLDADRQDVPSESREMIAVYGVTASAGHGSIVDTEEVIDRLSFPVGYLQHITRTHPRHLSIIAVKGDSMFPTLAHDDVVMLDSSKVSLSYDGLFVLDIDGALHVKRVSRDSDPGWIMIVSDNREGYPPFRRRLEDIRVLGRVIWKGQKV